MTTKTTLSRTLRLAAATAAAMVLMTQAAQAKPIGPVTPAAQGAASSSSGYQGSYRPAAGVVSLAPDRADGIGTSRAALGRSVTTAQTGSARTSGGGGFDWFAATLGAGSTLVVVLIAGAGLVARGRRRVPLSA